MTNVAQFVGKEEAAVRAGLTARALTRRLSAGEVRLFRDPRDRRRVLIPVEDIDRLSAPTPLVRRPLGDTDTAA